MSARASEMAEVTEYTVMMGHDSRYWAPRVDESDAFGPVTVYDAEGKVLRIVAKAALLREMPTRTGQTWNDRLFGRATDDRVGA